MMSWPAKDNRFEIEPESSVPWRKSRHSHGPGRACLEVTPAWQKNGSVFVSVDGRPPVVLVGRQRYDGVLTSEDLARIAEELSTNLVAEAGLVGDKSPVPEEAWSEYCLSVIEGLSRHLFPAGLIADIGRDDMLVSAGVGARRLLGLPATEWGRVSDWDSFVAHLRDIGAAAFVELRLPGRMSHAFALSVTNDGVAVVNPRADSRDVDVELLEPGSAHAAISQLVPAVSWALEARVLVVGPSGTVSPPDGTQGWTSTQDTAGNASVEALTDPGYPRIGAEYQRGSRSVPDLEEAMSGLSLGASTTQSRRPLASYLEIAQRPAPSMGMPVGDAQNQHAFMRNLRDLLDNVAESDPALEMHAHTPPRPALALHDFLSEADWWRLYINPIDHAAAARLRDPGRYYDGDQSLGFQAAMVRAYQLLLDGPGVADEDLDWGALRSIHELATRQVVGRFIAQSDETGHRWPQMAAIYASRPHADTLTRTIGPTRRPLMMSARSFVADPRTVPLTLYTREGEGQVAVTRTIYEHSDVEPTVNAVFDAYRASMGAARTDSQRLRAIAELIRDLHVLHVFADGNGRVNIFTLLPMLLLRNGYYPPVGTPGGSDLGSRVARAMGFLFNGGMSAQQMAVGLYVGHRTTQAQQQGRQWPPAQDDEPRGRQRGRGSAHHYGAPPASDLALADVAPDQGSVPDFYAPVLEGVPQALVARLGSLIEVDAGIEQQIAVRGELMRLAGLVFAAKAGPVLVDRIVEGNGRIVAVARTTPIGQAAEMDDWPRDQRGLYVSASGRAYVAEENVLGIGPDPALGVARYPHGYSSTIHELAHLLFDKGLTDDQRAVVEAAHKAILTVEAADRARHEAPGRQVPQSAHYAASRVQERFAAAVTAYLGDGIKPDNDGLAHLLDELYGERPVPGRANNIAGALADELNLTAARDLDTLAGIQAPQGLQQAPPEPVDAGARSDEQPTLKRKGKELDFVEQARREYEAAEEELDLANRELLEAERLHMHTPYADERYTAAQEQRASAARSFESAADRLNALLGESPRPEAVPALGEPAELSAQEPASADLRPDQRISFLEKTAATEEDEIPSLTGDDLNDIVVRVGSVLRGPLLRALGKVATTDNVQRAWHDLSPVDRRRPRNTVVQTIAEVIATGARLAMRGGHSGLEGEFTYLLIVNDIDDFRVVPEAVFRLKKKKLAYGPGFALTIDIKAYFVGSNGVETRYFRTREAMDDRGYGYVGKVVMAMPEFVTDVMQVLPGETSGPGEPAWRALRHLERDLTKLRLMEGSRPSVSLASVLRSEDGWELTGLGRATLVGPRPIGDWPGGHFHHSIGVPLDGLDVFLEHVQDHTWRDRPQGYMTKAFLREGLAFAADVARWYINWAARAGFLSARPGADAVELFWNNPEVSQLRGYAALLFTGAAALAHGYALPGSDFNKVSAAILARHDMSTVRAALTGEVRAFINSRQHPIQSAFKARFAKLVPNYEAMFREQHPEAGSIPDSILRPPGEEHLPADYLNARLSQYEVFDTTTLRRLDSTPLGDPMVVVEVRSYDVRHTSSGGAEEQHNTLGGVVRQIDYRNRQTRAAGQLALLGQHPEPAWFFFKQKSNEMDDGVTSDSRLRNMAQWLAQAALIQNEHLLPLPTVEIMGESKGGMFGANPGDTGRRRAQVIRELLRLQVRDHLRELRIHERDADAFAARIVPDKNVQGRPGNSRTVVATVLPRDQWADHIELSVQVPRANVAAVLNPPENSANSDNAARTVEADRVAGPQGPSTSAGGSTGYRGGTGGPASSGYSSANPSSSAAGAGGQWTSAAGRASMSDAMRFASSGSGSGRSHARDHNPGGSGGRSSARGLRGGSRDVGFDPVVSGLRAEVEVGLAPRGEGSLVFVDGPAGRGKGRVEGGMGSPTHAVFADWYHGTSADRGVLFELDEVGRIVVGDIVVPNEWVKHGADFLELHSGVVLRGDTGWLGWIGNVDELRSRLEDREAVRKMAAFGRVSREPEFYSLQVAAAPSSPVVPSSSRGEVLRLLLVPADSGGRVVEVGGVAVLPVGAGLGEAGLAGVGSDGPAVDGGPVGSTDEGLETVAGSDGQLGGAVGQGAGVVGAEPEVSDANAIARAYWGSLNKSDQLESGLVSELGVAGGRVESGSNLAAARERMDAAPRRIGDLGTGGAGGLGVGGVGWSGFNGLPAGVGWVRARWALSWDLGFGSGVGSVWDALLAAGGGLLRIRDEASENGVAVLETVGQVRAALGKDLGAGGVGGDAWPDAAARLGASVLVLDGKGSMQAYGRGPMLVVAETGAIGGLERGWVGLSGSGSGSALAGVGGAQITWAAGRGMRFLGSPGGFFEVLAATAEAAGVEMAQRWGEPRALRKALAGWMRSDLTVTQWAGVLGRAGVTGVLDDVEREGLVTQIERGVVDERVGRLLPVLAARFLGVDVHIVDTDGEVRSYPGGGGGPMVTLAPVAGPDALERDGWLGLGPVRPARAAGAATRPEDVPGGMSFAEPAGLATVDGAGSVDAGPSVEQRVWAHKAGRSLVEVGAGPDGLFEALVRGGGGLRMHGRPITDAASVREAMADDVRAALEADLGFSAVVHTVYKAHLASGGAPAGSVSGDDAAIDTGRVMAEIIRVIADPRRDPVLADQLILLFAHRLGIAVRVLDPSGLMHVYGQQRRPVYLAWSSGPEGSRWMVAADTRTHYALGSGLAEPNQSDPAMVGLARAAEIRRNTLRADAADQNAIDTDPLLTLAGAARKAWAARWAPQPTTATGPEPAGPGGPWDSQQLHATVTRLVQDVAASFTPATAPPDPAMAAGVGLSTAITVFASLAPRTGTDAAARRVPSFPVSAQWWVTTALRDVFASLPGNGAALIISGGRVMILSDTREGHRLIEFDMDATGRPTTQINVPTPDTGHQGALALIVDETGAPVAAEQLGARFETATGWSIQTHLETEPDTGRTPAVAGIRMAEWAREHQVRIVPATPGPDSVFAAILAANNGRIQDRERKVTVTNPQDLRDALAGYLRELLSAPGALHTNPTLHAAYVFAGAERIVEEFLDDPTRPTTTQAVYQQVAQHIETGKAAAYLVRALKEPGHWEAAAQLAAPEITALWSGLAVLTLTGDQHTRLHGNPDQPRLGLARLQPKHAGLPTWAALTPEHPGTNPLAQVTPDATTHVSTQTTIHVTGPHSLYQAILDAAHGAHHPDEQTLLTTPEHLETYLAKKLLERPDLLDDTTRAAIARETTLEHTAEPETIINTLTKYADPDAETLARHLTGAYLGIKLTITSPAGIRTTHGTGRPITLTTTTDQHDTARRIPTPDQYPDADNTPQHHDYTAIVEAENITPTGWNIDNHDTLKPGETPTKSAWSSSSFCAKIKIIVTDPEGQEEEIEQEACVSVTTFKLTPHLARRLTR